jgi:acyl-coenzyme A synthetase/AMP-(fatty) acid ligase
MITPLPGAWAEKPGSATLPFFGAAPVILDAESGEELEGQAEGVLCFRQVSLKHLHQLFESQPFTRTERGSGSSWIHVCISAPQNQV